MILILMGVVGSGKTTVGCLLAQQLHWKFADADDFHPAANIEKIRQGVALNDGDRRPWLELLRTNIETWSSAGVNVVLACSALKESYRKELTTGPDVQFVYLKGSADLIARRLGSREGHFAGAQILAAQLADLEEPKSAIAVDIDKRPEQIVSEIRNKLHLA
jgi:gluconokinase